MKISRPDNYKKLVAAIHRGAYPALGAWVKSGRADNVPALTGELSALCIVASQKSVRSTCKSLIQIIRGHKFVIIRDDA